MSSSISVGKKRGALILQRGRAHIKYSLNQYFCKKFVANSEHKKWKESTLHVTFGRYFVSCFLFTR